MKKYILLFCMLIGFGNTSQINAQIVVSGNNLNLEKTRDVYFFIVDLETGSDVQTLNDYLTSFDGKVISVSTDLVTQMCIMEIKKFMNEDIEQIILQAGFIGLVRDSLPPAGFKYVYNPDGTWKLKQL